MSRSTSGPPSSVSRQTPRPAPAAFVAAALVALTVAVYYGVWRFDFVSWDDPFYVVYNPRVMSGLTAPGVAWAFTTGYAFYWQPLTWLSHMADVQFFGPGASGPHAVNLVLHLLNTLLVFATFRRLTGAVGKSAFVAALFAIHPMHVESVAWIAERKDVLSTLFALLALYLYAGYASRPSSADTRASSPSSAWA